MQVSSSEGVRMVLTVLVTFLVTALLFALMYLRETRRHKRSLRQHYRSRLRDQEKKIEEMDGMVEALSTGLVYYDQEGRLGVLNQAAKEMLDYWPEDFKSMLDHYGEDNGMRAQLVLGKSQVNALVHEGKTVMDLRIYSLPGREASKLGHVVQVRDLSQDMREKRQQKEFVSNVAHELRTPLTTIQSYSESLIDWGLQEKKPEQLKKDLVLIYEDALRMQKLIEDLSLLSKVDESSIGRSMVVKALDLVPLAKQVTERMQAQAEERGMQLQCVVVANIPRIYADRSQLERILTNLLSNAIKYGKEAGKVHVYLGFLLDEVYMKVQDDGIGIDQEDQGHLFDRFFRVDNSGSRQYGGTGLGLSIVKEMVELHLGSIAVDSVRFQGSEFTVMLPSAEKVLKQAVYELSTRGKPLGPITEGAEEDLAKLAESMGLVANWKSLARKDFSALLQQIAEVKTWLGKRPTGPQGPKMGGQ